MKRRSLFVLAFMALLGIGVCVALLIQQNDSAALTGSKNVKLYPRDKKWRSPAFQKHLDKISRTIPGSGEGERGGPGGAGEQKIAAMAYPDSDIPYVRIQNARQAAKNAKQRGLPRGKGRSGWVSIGPSNAIYPFFEFRDTTLYVPNQYTASGRTTTIAIAPTCKNSSCRIWIGAAGGGVWRTKKALKGNPNWEYVSGSFEINSVGILYLDPNDPSGNTIYAGTGEPNGSGDSAHGVGIYKSTNGGDTWTGPLGQTEFRGRAVGTIAVEPGNPNIIYAGSGRAVHGVSSVSGGAITIAIPGAAMWGLYKSTDGGNTWAYIHNGGTTVAGCTDPGVVAGNTVPNCSPRGVRRIAIDPVNPNVIYSSAHARGIWRSSDAGATWEQIKATAVNSASNRAEFALTLLEDGNTRMYVAEGGGGGIPSVYRSDNVRAGAPTFTNLTSSNPADPGFGSFNYCTGQCIYDNFIYTPKDHPDMVYLGGSYLYGENDPFNSDGIPYWISNGRGVVLSQDGGVSWTDMSYDSTDFLHPNGLHPDHHALVTNPNNPFQFFETNDGGVVRSSGQLADISSQCDLRTQFDPDLTGAALDRCKQLLSAVPTQIDDINKGLTTLQFQSLSVNPFNSEDLQGGTQDNGTWESYGNPVKWLNTMIGDGGQSGFDVGNPNFRFHTFFVSQVDVNFSSGDVADWNWVADPFFIAGQGQSGSFYIPIINDPAVSGTLFAGINNVWRTKTFGLGALSLDAFRARCNEWTGVFDGICGDWERLGPLTLSSASWGDRAGGFVTAVERTENDTTTLWASTSTGRVFVSLNADANPAAAVTFTRIDSLAANDPGRFISGIFVDPSDPNHAWISYSGFSAATPTEPGHVFSVNYDPNTGTATWTSLEGNLGDMPVNDVVYDSNTGDLYIANDYGVLIDQSGGANSWQPAGPNMPGVEVAGLTIVPSARKLYAATHGLGAWSLNLP